MQSIIIFKVNYYAAIEQLVVRWTAIWHRAERPVLNGLAHIGNPVVVERRYPGSTPGRGVLFKTENYINKLGNT